ncbi:MAG: hypothetical protein MOGMAGMI_00873 [Candidatus Omnitrophica bacterium]|nr:hypothetical protein [Candidatus Omnitrophota bacterium]
MRSVIFANPFGIGDVLMTLRVVEAFRRARPQARIGFLGNERTAELLRMAPFIDRVHVLDRDGFRRIGWSRLPGAVRALCLEVRDERYDALADLSLGRELSAYAALLGIRTRVGLDHKGRGIWLTRRYPLDSYEGMPVSQRQSIVLQGLGVGSAELTPTVTLRSSPSAIEAARRVMDDLRGASGGAVPLAMAPGGGRSWGGNASYKQWDPDRFAQVAGSYATARGCGVLLVGDRSEEPLLDRIRTSLRVPARTMAGLPMGELASALSACRALLCNDGGPMHLASALGVPAVAIFGPVDELAYGPYGARAGSVLTADVPCRPCYKSFKFGGCAHQRACLERIEPARVLGALEKIA